MNVMSWLSGPLDLAKNIAGAVENIAEAGIKDVKGFFDFLTGAQSGPAGVDPHTIYQWFTSGAGTGDYQHVHGTFQSVAQAVDGYPGQLTSAQQVLQAGWQGTAADTANQSFSPLPTVATDLSTYAGNVLNQLGAQIESFNSARNTVVPVSSSPPYGPNLLDWAGLAVPGVDVIAGGAMVSADKAVGDYQRAMQTNQDAYQRYQQETNAQLTALSAKPVTIPAAPAPTGVTAPAMLAADVSPAGPRHVGAANTFAPFTRNPSGGGQPAAVTGQHDAPGTVVPASATNLGATNVPPGNSATAPSSVAAATTSDGPLPSVSGATQSVNGGPLPGNWSGPMTGTGFGGGSGAGFGGDAMAPPSSQPGPRSGSWSEANGQQSRGPALNEREPAMTIGEPGEGWGVPPGFLPPAGNREDDEHRSRWPMNNDLKDICTEPMTVPPVIDEPPWVERDEEHEEWTS